MQPNLLSNTEITVHAGVLRGRMDRSRILLIMNKIIILLFALYCFGESILGVINGETQWFSAGSTLPGSFILFVENPILFSITILIKIGFGIWMLTFFNDDE